MCECNYLLSSNFLTKYWPSKLLIMSKVTFIFYIFWVEEPAFFLYFIRYNKIVKPTLTSSRTQAIVRNITALTQLLGKNTMHEQSRVPALASWNDDPHEITTCTKNASFAWDKRSPDGRIIRIPWNTQKRVQRPIKAMNENVTRLP